MGLYRLEGDGRVAEAEKRLTRTGRAVDNTLRDTQRLRPPPLPSPDIDHRFAEFKRGHHQEIPA